MEAKARLEEKQKDLLVCNEAHRRVGAEHEGPKGLFLHHEVP